MAKRRLLSTDEVFEFIKAGDVTNIVEVDFETEKVYSLEELGAVDFVADLTNENRVFFFVNEEV